MKLTVSQRSKAAAIYDRVSGDGNALEGFIYEAVGRQAALEDLIEVLRKTRIQGALLASFEAACEATRESGDEERP